MLFENFIMFWCKRISILFLRARIAQLVERVTCMRETRTREISISQVFTEISRGQGFKSLFGLYFFLFYGFDGFQVLFEFLYGFVDFFF